ncbi:pilus assembly protein [Moritella sp. 24]|uniref:TadE/TadG family type IV pilus assembly protein n=1 Tax=Moritella sp. 24 TaxID=2746230 RepID=UPI001BAD8969|nr:TadE/TadG family type IV pilus assembly protein [Moritella sp. 24]QUM78039.1 pilus assembly protein [Moritella sp. 24]
MKRSSISRPSKTDQRGIIAIEAIIVLPIMILIMLTILDFGRVMHASITTTNSARSAAGYGAQNTNSAIDYTGMKSAALADATNLKVDDYNTSAVTITTERICRCVGGSNISCGSTSSCNLGVEVYVKSTATRDFRTLAPYPIIPNSVQLTRSATIRIQ